MRYMAVCARKRIMVLARRKGMRINGCALIVNQSNVGRLVCNLIEGPMARETRAFAYLRLSQPRRWRLGRAILVNVGQSRFVGMAVDACIPFVRMRLRKTIGPRHRRRFGSVALGAIAFHGPISLHRRCIRLLLGPIVGRRIRLLRSATRAQRNRACQKRYGAYARNTMFHIHLPPFRWEHEKGSGRVGKLLERLIFYVRERYTREVEGGVWSIALRNRRFASEYNRRHPLRADRLITRFFEGRPPASGLPVRS